MQPDISETIDGIKHWHRQRIFAMRQRIRADLALGAFLRTVLGWRKDAPEKDRDAAAKIAADLIKNGQREVAGKAFDPDMPGYAEWRLVITASTSARKPFADVEARAAKEMEKLAKMLPVWEWADGVRGFGARSLAVIIGEAGNLSSYPKKGHLWKRMGLAVLDGVRQGGLGKAAGDQAWVEHGYNPYRRSQMFVIGDSLVKGGEYYRQVYLDRKSYERAKAEAAGYTVAPSAKIPKARKDEFVSDGMIHARAQRYMEKRLLKDLWQAWNADRWASKTVPSTAKVFPPADRLASLDATA